MQPDRVYADEMGTVDGDWSCVTAILEGKVCEKLLDRIRWVKLRSRENSVRVLNQDGYSVTVPGQGGEAELSRLARRSECDDAWQREQLE